MADFSSYDITPPGLDYDYSYGGYSDGFNQSHLGVGYAYSSGGFTDGFDQMPSGNVDADPPIIANFDPISGSTIARTSYVEVDVTDPGGALAAVLIWVEYPGLGVTELAYDGASSVAPYTTVPTPIVDGFTYQVSRAGGWKHSPRLRVGAVDTGGNVTTAFATYTSTPTPAAPSVTNFSPAAPTTISHSATITFDVTDDGTLGEIVVRAQYSSLSSEEVIHDGTSFVSPYTGSKTPISGGYTFVVSRTGTGWKHNVELRVFAIDDLGNETSLTTGLYSLTPTPASPAIVFSTPTPPTTIAHGATVQVDITDDAAISGFNLRAVYSSLGVEEMIHDGVGFVSPYTGSVTPVTGGYQIVASRGGVGWKHDFTLKSAAVDSLGNISVATSGLYSLTPTPAAPSVAAFSPAAPGPVTVTQAVDFEVTDDSTSIAELRVSVRYPALNIEEVVYNGSSFVSPYTGSVTGIANGFDVSISRGGTGWKHDFEVRVFALDNLGNETAHVTAEYDLTPPPPPPDTGSPTVANVLPTPGTPIEENQPVTFDVTDETGIFRRILVTVRYSNTGITEVVHDGDSFQGAYSLLSNRNPISGGFHYSIIRDEGWPGSPTLRVFAFDRAGNES